MATAINFTIDSLDLHNADYVQVNLYTEGEPDRSIIIYSNGSIDASENGTFVKTVTIYDN
jgi:hypothetical protein